MGHIFDKLYIFDKLHIFDFHGRSELICMRFKWCLGGNTRRCIAKSLHHVRDLTCVWWITDRKCMSYQGVSCPFLGNVLRMGETRFTNVNCDPIFTCYKSLTLDVPRAIYGHEVLPCFTNVNRPTYNSYPPQKRSREWELLWHVFIELKFYRFTNYWNILSWW